MAWLIYQGFPRFCSQGRAPAPPTCFLASSLRHLLPARHNTRASAHRRPGALGTRCRSPIARRVMAEDVSLVRVPSRRASSSSSS